MKHSTDAEIGEEIDNKTPAKANSRFEGKLVKYLAQPCKKRLTSEYSRSSFLIRSNMTRKRPRVKQIHQPTTHEIFICLSGYLSYSRILLSERPDKKYFPFLEWIVENNFYNERAGKVSIKDIAADFGADAAKVTAWLRAIYEDIFELNQEKPELFQQTGIKVSLSISYLDNYCMFYTALPALPRRFEQVHLFFVKAKLGGWSFWVRDIYYELDEQPTIHLTLDGSILNRYREFLLEKALFQRKLGRSDLSNMYNFQVDDWLQQFDR